MNRNLILAFALSLAVYAGWALWVEKNYKPLPRAARQSAPATAGAQLRPDDKRTAITAQTVTVAGAGPGETVSLPAIAFHTPEAEVLFNPRGAAISSFKFFGPAGIAELVPHSNPGFFATMSQTEFALKKKTDNSLTFSAEPMKGFVIEKTYNWVEGGIGRITVTAQNRLRKTIEIPEWALRIGPGIGTVPSEKEENPKLWQASFAVNQADRKLPVAKNLSKETPAGPWLWAGVHNRYFLAAVMPDNWPAEKLVYEPKALEKEKAPGLAAPVEKMLLAPGARQEWSLYFYIGPKDYRHLLALGHGLDRSVDFGFFGPIGKAVLKVLYFNHRLTGNYGWAIILLTIFVQILMSPLTYKGFKATMIMKQLQPKLAQIQAKYKGNPARLNQEMLELYRKHGANPFSGCLPMVLQIPIFFALFTALRNSWDLHGAVFTLWVTDLSAKDPYYVLPIVMGAIMFFQQKFTMSAPAGGDPAQMAVMKWMPVIFTFMFLSFPSGLVLYWLTSSLIGFGQQMYLQKRMAVPV